MFRIMTRAAAYRSAAATAALMLGAGIPAMAAAQSAPPPSAPAPASGFAMTDATDPYIWLEDIESPRVNAWVAERNARTLDTLQSHPVYETLHQQALDILQSRDRIPSGGLTRGGKVDNFWQDADHVRGIWRRTTVESYNTDNPVWETILDVDALAAAENANWVYKGSNCLQPEGRYCLLQLSNGGKDATTVREYDTVERKFVEGGISFPESKSGISWIDRDTLLISDAFTEAAQTTSGYSRVVRVMKRGQSVEQAPIVYEGKPDDMSISAYVLRDADGVAKATFINRAIDFYSRETFELKADGSVVPVPLPAKGGITALVAGKLVVSTDEPWTAPSGQTFKTGDVFAYDFEDWKADKSVQAQLVISPGEREAIEGISATRNKLIVALYENVRGSIYVYDPSDWSRTRLDLPENVTVGIGSTSRENDRFFASVSGYLTPSTLYMGDAATGTVAVSKSLPAKFDASGKIVEQHEAVSKDGTRVPYFVVRNENAPMDGSNPTLLYGYGGFQNSLLPSYSATMGKLWLERGGVYVIANTRGGGEFGPRWHQAALQQNRQRAHEDFQAVAEDLIARGITSQPHLGIMGGSQGGLFMGAMLTQRPDLINAAIIQVPLFDMLRFHKLLAGASWIGEYGNPDIPEQRAWIAEYSPYQKLDADAPYPEVFIHTSTKDDRVHPGHARKAVARLEELGHQVLFYENTDGGHAAGANLRETARRQALEYTYLTRRLMDDSKAD
ncbi:MULTISPECIES: prolyl oligopeptidase family serine peptidase [unclassified Brevundimonas]|uniref:prolyl oligopeptidase family serine peptidase n=1 Tax=unclassified Brevundimonas TaxID=2622653 RepID=UPI0025BD699C|nr:MULTISPECIES: prolyl oligopeptidase family serine peptidase [unclassified Brevundimonas]